MFYYVHRFLHHIFSCLIGLYGSFFLFVGNAVAAMGVTAFKRSHNDDRDSFVLTPYSDSFTMDNKLAAHGSHSSHSSHTSGTSPQSHASHSSHTSGTSPQSHTSHSSHYSGQSPKYSTETLPEPATPSTISSPPIIESTQVAPEQKNTAPNATTVPIDSEAQDQEYVYLCNLEQRALVYETLQTGSRFLSPLILLKKQVASFSTKETNFFLEISEAIKAVQERKHFKAAPPPQGTPFYKEKKTFYDIRVEWDIYLENASKKVFERGQAAYTDLKNRALQTGNTNLVKRIEEKFAPSSPTE